jgi:CheY-like chemotaxis protein
MIAPSLLLVEDDENDVVLFERALKKTDVRAVLHVVRDGQEAIDYVNGTGMYTDRERHPFPRVMILDLHLPRKRGLDVLREVRGQAKLRTMPIVVLTASSSVHGMRQAYDAGANSFLVKPGDLQQLNEFVRLLADYWLRVNRVPLDLK